MAARVQQLVSKAKSAAEPLYATARSQAVKQYESLMSGNAQYVVKDKAAEDKLLKQWFFTKMARCVDPRWVAAQRPNGAARCRLGAPQLSGPSLASLFALCRIPSGIAHAQEESVALRQRLRNFRDVPVPEVRSANWRLGACSPLLKRTSPPLCVVRTPNV